ncbi:sensor domain-containing diguanylate cyclase [Pantoea stewartii]|nr:sensor domain-containing diguanylate cyclase [Pantoea stewartii]
MEKNKRDSFVLSIRSIAASFLVFLLSLSLGFFTLTELNKEIESKKNNETSAVAKTFSTSVKSVLERTLTATRSLAVMVYQGDGYVGSFRDLSRFVLAMYKGAYALSLAPNGIIRQVEPLNRNLIVRGHDLLEGIDREEYLKTLKENEIEFFGPFKLIQGPIGATGQLPVFLHKNGRKYFWGFTVVTLEFPSALEDANLKAISSQGYAYILSGEDPFTKETRVLEKSINPYTGGVCEGIFIGKMKWRLCVSPLSSSKSNRQNWFEFILIICVSLSISGFTYMFLELKKKTCELSKVALYDPLTGLPNRRLMFRTLKKKISFNSKRNDIFAVAYIDLDGFKFVNDNLGHKQGDQLLLATASRIRNVVKKDDLVSRIGGDEFVIIMSDIHNRDELLKILLSILRDVNKSIYLKGEIVKVSASIGVSLVKNKINKTPDYILSEADRAM